jgi:hypothetical protein
MPPPDNEYRLHWFAYATLGIVALVIALVGVTAPTVYTVRFVCAVVGGLGAGFTARGMRQCRSLFGRFVLGGVALLYILVAVLAVGRMLEGPI